MPHPVEGWKFRYMRSSSLGELDTLNVGAYRREGWEIVHPSECPECAFGMPEDADRIEVGGLVLVKIASEIVAQRDHYYQRLGNSQLEAVDNQLMSESDPRMPLFRDRAQKTSRSPRG
jgi:hypothetical protein